MEEETANHDDIIAAAMGMGFEHPQIVTALAMCGDSPTVDQVVSTLLSLDSGSTHPAAPPPPAASAPQPEPVLSLRAKPTTAPDATSAQPVSAVHVETPLEKLRREQKQKQREKDMEAAAAKLKAEKARLKEERKRVLQEIEENKAERREKGPAAVPTAGPSASLGPARIVGDAGGSARVQIRLPGGNSVVEDFDSTATLADVLRAARRALVLPARGEADESVTVQTRMAKLRNTGGAYRLGDGNAAVEPSEAEKGRQQFLAHTEKLMREAAAQRAAESAYPVQVESEEDVKLMIPFPRREFEDGELGSITVEEAGLVPSGTVVIQRVKDSGTVQQGRGMMGDDELDDEDDEDYVPEEDDDDDHDEDRSDGSDESDGGGPLGRRVSGPPVRYGDDERNWPARPHPKARRGNLAGAGRVLGSAEGSGQSRLLANSSAPTPASAGSAVGADSPLVAPMEKPLVYDKKRERERLRRQIEADREERRSRAPAVSAFASTTPEKAPVAASAPAPTPVTGVSSLRIRCSDGSVLQSTFRGSDTMQVVHDFVRRSGSVNCDFFLYTPLPRTEFQSSSSRNATLASLGLVPGGVLCISTDVTREEGRTAPPPEPAPVPAVGQCEREVKEDVAMEAVHPPSLEEGMAEIQVRLPQGDVISSTFRSTSVYGHVQQFVAASLGIEASSFSMFIPLPRREFCYAAVLEQSIQSLGLVPRAMLVFQHKPLEQNAPEGAIESLIVKPSPVKAAAAKGKGKNRVYPKAWKEHTEADEDMSKLSIEERQARQVLKIKEMRQREKEERARIRREFEADQTERRRQLAPPATTSANVAPTHPVQPSSYSAVGSGNIQIRLPDGSVIVHHCNSKDTLLDLRGYLTNTHADLLPAGEFTFLQLAPRQHFDLQNEGGLTLGGIGVVPDGTLVVQGGEFAGSVREGRRFNPASNRWYWEDAQENNGDEVDVDHMSYEDLLNLTDGTEVRRGMSRLEVQSIPIKKYAKTGPGDDKCPICCYEFVEEECIKELKGCSHTFHAFCIDRWLNNASHCPICRKEV